jgi:hypothetical protein
VGVDVADPDLHLHARPTQRGRAVDPVHVTVLPADHDDPVSHPEEGEDVIAEVGPCLPDLLEAEHPDEVIERGPLVSVGEAGEPDGGAKDLLGADPSAIVFGRSATQLTYDVSRTLARTWRPGDEVVVSRLDHDANVRRGLMPQARPV